MAATGAGVNLLLAWAAEDWDRVQLLAHQQGDKPVLPMVEPLLAAAVMAVRDLALALGQDPSSVLENLRGSDDYVHPEERRTALRGCLLALVSEDRGRFESVAPALQPLNDWDLPVALIETVMDSYGRLAGLRSDGITVEHLVVALCGELSLRRQEPTS